MMKKIFSMIAAAMIAALIGGAIIGCGGDSSSGAKKEGAATGADAKKAGGGAKSGGASSDVEPIAWYGCMPHPYISEVKAGVEACAKDLNVKIFTMVGQEWTQDNENQNVESLSTKGHKAFSIYPADAAGANGLFKGLTSKGFPVVAYGAEPGLPTPASFTVATDIKGAAMAACEELIKLMGDKGNILNVLETVTDINTRKRDEGIKEIVAKHPNVKIIQTIADMTQVAEATNKIQSALAARGGEIDGIITTGYNPTIAAAAILTEWHKNPGNKRIKYIGIDTGPTVLQAIRDGSIDATLAQNPFGHGYIPCAILKLMLDGWKPVKDYQFVNAGMLIVNKSNVDTYSQEVRKITDGILADLKTKYLTPPAK
ncbi:MAG: substrate-binding domain-containing protein [Candidatus Sumerlaeota bacterium]|nr:substrate-binding domain-containing protein [Candidatus Sumerlaeota bacterium]